MSLRETEQEVLLDLRRGEGNGDNIQSNIADNIERRMKTTGKALDDLESKGLIVDKGRGVYRLTEQGRDVASNLDALGDAL